MVVDIAATRGSLPIVKTLVEWGVPATLRDLTGWSTLHTVCGSIGPQNCVEIAEFLIAHGANVNALDSKKYTPLHLACKPYFVLFMLVDRHDFKRKYSLPPS